MTSFPGTIVLTKTGSVANIVLNRPDVINAYNVQMRDELWDALEFVRDDPEVRAVVLSGAGERGFCSGADLTEFGTAPSLSVAREVRFERGVWELWAGIEKPFVVALHGYVLGSGLEMALMCDLRLGSGDVRFGLPEVALGTLPGAGGTQTVPRTLGIPSAMEMLLTNRRLDSQKALDLGLLHWVFPRGKLFEEAWSLAVKLASLDSRVVRLAKKVLLHGMDLPLSSALELEERLALQALIGYQSQDLN